MDGLLVIDKPVGPTSHDVVARVRRATGERRVGHTGTLDPAASGVLPLVLGRATRLARFLSAADKSYEAVIQLGVPTDTDDSEGEIIGAAYDGPLPSRDEIDRALDAFRGTFLQQPPAYSAKKIAGVRSYTLARAQARRSRSQLLSSGERLRQCRAEEARIRGEASALERAGGGAPAPLKRKLTSLPDPITVTVHDLELVDTDGSLVSVRVRCSAGFYVRSLAHDLGERLGIGAHLTALRRTRSGDVALADAIPLDEIERSLERAAAALVPPGRMLPALAALVLTAEGVKRARHGRDLGPADVVSHEGSAWTSGSATAAIRLLDEKGDLIGVAEPAGAPGLLHPSVVLV